MKSPPAQWRPGVHLLVCNNRREVGATLPCCADAGGAEVLEGLRQLIQRRGLARSVWVTETRCLSFCNTRGATVVAWPGGQWFTEVGVGDVPTLLDQVLPPR